MLIVMIDWKVGRSILAERIAEMSPPLTDFVAKIQQECPVRVPGTAIILSSSPEGTPPVLTTQARRIRAMREHVVLLTVTTDHVPFVKPEDRVRTEDLGNGFHRVWIRSGFMEKPNVPKILASARLPVDLEDATYFLGRETFLAGKGGKMGVVSESLFAFLSRNAKSGTSWFGIPPDQVVELGMRDRSLRRRAGRPQTASRPGLEGDGEVSDEVHGARRVGVDEGVLTGPGDGAASIPGPREEQSEADPEGDRHLHVSRAVRRAGAQPKRLEGAVDLGRTRRQRQPEPPVPGAHVYPRRPWAVRVGVDAKLREHREARRCWPRLQAVASPVEDGALHRGGDG